MHLTIMPMFTFATQHLNKNVAKSSYFLLTLSPSSEFFRVSSGRLKPRQPGSHLPGLEVRRVPRAPFIHAPDHTPPGFFQFNNPSTQQNTWPKVAFSKYQLKGGKRNALSSKTHGFQPGNVKEALEAEWNLTEQKWGKTLMKATCLQSVT